jgi:hypothetical protein
MKTTVIAVLVLAFAAFMGAVVWFAMEGAEVECEVCLVFGGEEVCRSGRAASTEEALAAAQQSACGGNVSGMAESIACLGRIPDRQSCSAR